MVRLVFFILVDDVHGIHVRVFLHSCVNSGCFT